MSGFTLERLLGCVKLWALLGSLFGDIPEDHSLKCPKKGVS